MENDYTELIEFKYQSNLLYAESILKKEQIDFKVDNEKSIKLFVKPEDQEKALTIINQLNLDESEVSEDSDGYLNGYNEWADKRFVSGYFTGGTIPLWMYNKTYAKFYGPFLIVSGLLAFFIPIINVNDNATFLNTQYYSGKLIVFTIYTVYMVCGVLLTIKGFKK